jgi:hypothetical protein
MVTPDDRAMKRVSEALKRSAPSCVTWVGPEQARLTILHVNGRVEQFTEQAGLIKKTGKYAVIQYAVRSTQKPRTDAWLRLWAGAKLVWSYYNLKELLLEDALQVEFPFYHSALGVDPAVFYPRGTDRTFGIVTTGQSWLTESVKECARAAWANGKTVAHLGPNLRRSGVVCHTDVSDEVVAGLYSSAEYVSGLRRVEGFELPAAEGLLCGARPIVFNRPHYRTWYDGLAIFVPELSRPEVTDWLQDTLSRKPVPVSQAEIDEGAARFNWPRICRGFWERVL